MSGQLDYAAYEGTIAQLRGATDRFREVTKHPSVDKKGIGFNRDSRFRAIEIKVTFDSWSGVFGCSSCQRVVCFDSPELFRTAFVAYLNRHYQEIFDEMADLLEQESEDAKSRRVAELEAELERLRSQAVTA